MKKFELNFPLHNNFFYYGSMFVMVLIVVMGNNYFFYRNKESVLYNQLKDMAHLIGGFYENCLETQPDQICKSNLVSVIQRNWDYGRISIFDIRKNTVLDFDKETYLDPRTKILYDTMAGSGDQQITIIISKLSSPPLYLSVWKSMTLSLGEIPSKDVIRFFKKVAFPRSSSILYAIFVIFFIMRFARATDRARLRYSQILENRIIRKRTLLKNVREKKASIEDEIKNLRSKIEYTGSENKLLWEEIATKEKEFAQQSEIEGKLLKDISEKEKEIFKLSEKLEQTSKVFEKLFTNNPDVNLSEKELTYHLEVPHGSVPWTASVAESLKKDPIGSRLISRISGAQYERNNSGKAVLKWNAQNKEYILTAYNTDGYSVLMALNCRNLSGAILISKYILLISKGKIRNNYEFEIHNNVIESKAT